MQSLIARLYPMQVFLFRFRWSLVDQFNQYRSFSLEPIGVRLQKVLFYYLYMLMLIVRILTVYFAVLNEWWEYFNRYDHIFGLFLKRQKYSPLLFLSASLLPL